MRPLYAVQFELTSPKSDATSDVAEKTFRTVQSWISESYLFRKGIKIEFPAAGCHFSPCQSHELIVNREMSPLGEVSHSAVSWSYPGEGENFGNLLWNSRCEVSKFGGLTEFSFQLLLESTQFYIKPVDFKLRRPRLIATLLREFVCTHGDERLSTEPRSLSAQGVALGQLGPSNDQQVPDGARGPRFWVQVALNDELSRFQASFRLGCSA